LELKEALVVIELEHFMVHCERTRVAKTKHFLPLVVRGMTPVVQHCLFVDLIFMQHRSLEVHSEELDEFSLHGEPEFQEVLTSLRTVLVEVGVDGGEIHRGW
jgi:hypothetical protein